MENSGYESEEELSVESDFPLTRLFEKLCPIYMSYGMSYDEYWNEDSYRCKFYREAYELKQKRYDEFMWMGGMYIYDTLCRVYPIYHDFAKSGTKPLPYVERPYSLSEEYKKSQNKLTEEEKQNEVERERLRAEIHFNNLARMLDAKFKKDTENKEENKTEEK